MNRLIMAKFLEEKNKNSLPKNEDVEIKNEPEKDSSKEDVLELNENMIKDSWDEEYSLGPEQLDVEPKHEIEIEEKTNFDFSKKKNSRTK